MEFLLEYDLSEKEAYRLASRWLIQGDFLLTNLGFDDFDFVVGNPPYVRQELIDDRLLMEYRARYKTIYDRADLYVPFYERSLSVLKSNGVLGFICADRWMKNKYGGPLREFVSESFSLKTYVDMYGTAAFHSEVSAYPAITIIENSKQKGVRIAHRPEVNSTVLKAITEEILSEGLDGAKYVRELKNVVCGREPWLLESVDQLELIRRLEFDYPKIEDVGCKIGIGVATGADKAFIADYDSMDVESDRKLPLATTKDILSGEVEWKGKGVLNPFREDGKLVDLENYPRLKKYLEDRKEHVAKRHVAKKAPENWYRTIDRIWPDLTFEKKLLIPDIKGSSHIVYEQGKLYPHHNLYYITSKEWDLKALQAVMMSSVARLFVATYSTKMRGGFLRFQAQYLRRIRIPQWSDVSEGTREALISAANRRDVDACDRAVFKLFNLNEIERAAVGGNGQS